MASKSDFAPIVVSRGGNVVVVGAAAAAVVKSAERTRAARNIMTSVAPAPPQHVSIVTLGLPSAFRKTARSAS